MKFIKFKKNQEYLETSIIKWNYATSACSKKINL